MNEEKDTWRLELKKRRSELSFHRREEARLSLVNQLLPVLARFDYVLSFASFGDEIDTTLLNFSLASATSSFFLKYVVSN